MNIVIVGHVDHGKSTIVGRLLADTDSLPQGKLEQVKFFCESKSRPFEYAFLLDALRDERAQGITIDSARVFFKSDRRSYIITDAPGHIEFLKNMVSGASRADAALLVIDAHEGIQENSRRHAYLLSLLGIRQLVVLINKMDLLDYAEARFANVVAEFDSYLTKVGLKASCYIPVVGYAGDNLVRHSPNMPWYLGPAVLEKLDSFKEAKPLGNLPFRMPVQDVYKFTAKGDTRRIVAGTVESGTAGPGDEIVFYPSGKRSRLKSIENFPTPHLNGLEPGRASGFTLNEQIYVTRGEVAGRADQQALQISNRFKTSLFWLGKRPLHSGKDYILKIGSARTRARLEQVVRVIDSSTLEARPDAQTVERNEAAECVFCLARPIAFDLEQLTPATSRFVLVDDYEISGGGIVREDLSVATTTDRAARFRQKSLIIVLENAVLADHELEQELLEQGRAAYQLATTPEKLVDQVCLLLDAGMIVLLPVPGKAQATVAALQKHVSAELIQTLDTMAHSHEEQAPLEKIMKWTEPDQGL